MQHLHNLPNFTIDQSVSRRPVITEVWFRFDASPCEIFGGQSGIGTRVSSSISIFLCYCYYYYYYYYYYYINGRYSHIIRICNSLNK